MENTSQPSHAQTDPRNYEGGCHCGAVRYRVALDLGAGINECNCSICKKTNFVGAIAKPSGFQLLAGERELTDYQFNSESIHHVFCKHCGIRSYSFGHIPEIGGDFISINVNCLDDAEADVAKAPVKRWNGRDNDWG